VDWIYLPHEKDKERVTVRAGMNQFGSTEFWKFVERLRNYKLFKKGCPPLIYLVV
jgi:hypothetical protein